MEKPTQSNIVTINLKKAKKNHRMDIFCNYLDSIENGVIIVFDFLETLTYFPYADSVLKIKEHLKNNNYRKFSSVPHCLCCLDLHKRNVIIVSEKVVYLTNVEDSLASIMFDSPNIKGTSFRLEFDASTNGIKAKYNCSSNVVIRSSLENQKIHRRHNVKLYGRSRPLALYPRERKIASIDKKDIFPHLKPKLKYKGVIPVYQVRHELDNSPSVMDVVNSLDHSSLSTGKFLYGSIVQDCAGSGSLTESSTAQREPSLQTDAVENVELHTRVSHNNLSQRDQSDEATSMTAYSTQIQHVQWLQLPKHPMYSTYDSRIASYANFSEFRNLDTNMFARTGLFYIGEADTIKCFQCGIELSTWKTGKDLVTEHVKMSPDCSFLKEPLVAVILNEHEAQVRSSGRISRDENSSSTSNNAGATNCAFVPIFTTSDKIRSPKYQPYTVRLSTFIKWPPSITQKPEQVAQAGFYYTGLQDVVRCFACDGGLKNWDPEDDPWIEHARWFPQCPYVQKVKGQEFVDLVRRMTEESDEEEDAVVHSTFQRNNPMANPPDLQLLKLGNDTDEPSQLDTDAAQLALQTGYCKSAVAMAIDALISKGRTEYTAQDIMEVIFEKEERGEALPTDSNSQPPQTPSQSVISIPSVYEENDTENDTGDIQTILRENESLKSVVICIKCKSQARNTLFLPCTHHCLCQICAEKCSLCPVCYKVIKQKIKTFMI